MRSIYAYFAETADFPRHLYAPDAEFDATDVMPDVGVVQGLGPMDTPEAAFRTYAGLFDDYEITLEAVVASDDAHVVTTVTDGGRLKGTDARVSNRFHHAWTVSDGRIARWSTHLTLEQALAAVGLEQR